jgi:hypothetical protein
MNIFKEFVLSRPVRQNPLVFGHNENIVIEAVDFSERKKKGITIQANTFIKLTKVSPEDRSAIASTEINFWNLDPTKEFVYDNFISQFSILCGIIDAVGGNVEEYETYVLGAVEGADDNEILAFLKKAVNAKAAQTALIDGFKTQIEGKTGLSSVLLKCKMISNKAGFLQPANDSMWILPMDSELGLPEISAKETRAYKKALETDTKKATPDATGTAPAQGEATVSASSLASI